MPGPAPSWVPPSTVVPGGVNRNHEAVNRAGRPVGSVVDDRRREPIPALHADRPSRPKFLPR
jgi:hypothetical protein